MSNVCLRSLRIFGMVAAAVLAGCSPPDGPTVATAQQPTAGASVSPSVSAKESDYDKALRFTRCMTGNGVKTPDPVEGKPLFTGSYRTSAGLVALDLNESAAQRQARLRAFAQCEQFLPASWPIKADPQVVARSRPYNECLKQHGFPQPEPDANGMLHLPLPGGRPQAGITESGGSTPEFEAAMQACRHLFDDPANGRDGNS